MSEHLHWASQPPLKQLQKTGTFEKLMIPGSVAAIIIFIFLDANARPKSLYSMKAGFIFERSRNPKKLQMTSGIWDWN